MATKGMVSELRTAQAKSAARQGVPAMGTPAATASVTGGTAINKVEGAQTSVPSPRLNLKKVAVLVGLLGAALWFGRKALKRLF